MTEIKPSKTPKEIKEELNLEENQPVIGTAGRMVPIKGYDLLLEAARKILDKNPRVGLLIAGDGPLLNELKQKTEKLGIDGNVQFLGFRNDITNILFCLDIFVMSSHNEGIPMVLLEAMTLQKPVVSTAVGGIKEVITDNISGRLVEPGNTDALAKGCLELLQNPQTRMKLAEGARKRIKEEFSSERLTERMVRLYQSLMN
jgi:glycosyltransferase involved in cell wall biosynthesis